MPERPRRPNLDERFSLHPTEAEEALETLLEGPGTTTLHDGDEDEGLEDEDS